MKKNILKAIQKTIGLYLNILSFISPKKTGEIGFKLFCNPLSKKIKAHQLDYLEKGKNDVLDFNDLKIQTYKWGNGSKNVLLVHGWGSHTFRWKSYIEKLTQNNYTVYAFDAPAHGLSSGKMLHIIMYSEIIELFIQKNKVENIISHSIGGFATTYWLYKNKNQQIKKTVIMAAPGEATDFFEFYKNILGLSKKATEIIIQKFAHTLQKHPSYFSSVKFASNITTSCLIIHDKQDKDTNPKYSINLSKSWTNSQLILTEGLGHNLKSKKIEEKVLQFISN